MRKAAVWPLGAGCGGSWGWLAERSPITRQKIHSDILPMNSPHCPRAPLATPGRSEWENSQHLFPSEDPNLPLGAGRQDSWFSGRE